jgi:UDP-N-acetylglucosamine 4-epimerase
MNTYEILKAALVKTPRAWLVTGCAGFIGSNIVETLLGLGQTVRGLDNFATGHERNLEEVRSRCGAANWERFEFIRGDIRDIEVCRRACAGLDYVLHQAALGSVPRSIEDPLSTHLVNVDGMLHMLSAARDAKIKRFVYASSSSVYGDEPSLPKIEARIGAPLSPYAVSKYVNELYAAVFAQCYSVESVGLRYFNVFGPRQDPEGPYAAVIPKWVAALLGGQEVFINGDGETSRDFCYVSNAVQANLLGATAPLKHSKNLVLNVSVGERTTLNELFGFINQGLAELLPERSFRGNKPVYREFRSGDVRHSQADIGYGRSQLGYEPTHTLSQGLKEALGWYVAEAGRAASS